MIQNNLNVGCWTLAINHVVWEFYDVRVLLSKRERVGGIEKGSNRDKEWKNGGLHQNLSGMPLTFSVLVLIKLH